MSPIELLVEDKPSFIKKSEIVEEVNANSPAEEQQVLTREEKTLKHMPSTEQRTIYLSTPGFGSREPGTTIGNIASLNKKYLNMPPPPSFTADHRQPLPPIRVNPPE